MDEEATAIARALAPAAHPARLRMASTDAGSTHEEFFVMNALDVLRAQHREVRALFQKIIGGRDLESRTVLVDTLIGTLRLHTRLEERSFYPALRQLRTKHAEDTVLESIEEHDIVDGLLAQLPAMDHGSERFEARIRVLQSLVELHIEEEEAAMFEQAEQLGNDELIAIGMEMQGEIDELARVNEILDRAASATRRTESWAGRLLDMSVGLPRQTISRFAPSRVLGLDRRGALVATIAESAPRWLVDGVYERLIGNGNGDRRQHRPETESGRRMEQATSGR